MSAAKLSIAALNALDRAAFIDRFGGIYERSPWVAEAAWSARPFGDRAALDQALQEAVLRAGKERQLELLRNHPSLGTRLPLSGASRAEQTGAGITDATAAQRADLEKLNGDYEKRFGIPFILAVRGADLAAILENCRSRIGADRKAEFDESLRQVFRIAAFRLADLL